ncbi:FAD-dependent monooxygenase [Microbacterium sp.]|uniref:FAD-dependent monooxygenase n=1 Tax=Microbacterium sp. TaxID=51671 RepID=UPI003A85B720
MSKATLLVVGGGIGGLSAAIALRGAGYDLTVAERYPDAHASVFGVGIIQPANALRALDAIGCARACLDTGFAASAWGSMYDVDGRFLRDMPGTAIAGADYPPMNGLTRPRLHEILTDRARALGVRIRYASEFAALEQYDDGVDVHFADGEVDRFDLVVGADGVRSAVRGHVLPADVRPRYIGQSAFRLNIPREPEIDRIVLQAGPSGMAGFVPIGPDQAYLFYNTTMARDDRPASHELADALRAHLAPFGGLTGRVRDAHIGADADIVLRPEESLIAPAPWHRGRVVLIGDAVHTVTPHLGQGAAQAIEDGVVLAEELATDGDHARAFARYTERRYERCRLVVETCDAIGEWEMGLRPDFDNIAATNHVLDVMASAY